MPSHDPAQLLLFGVRILLLGSAVVGMAWICVSRLCRNIRHADEQDHYRTGP